MNDGWKVARRSSSFAFLFARASTSTVFLLFLSCVSHFIFVRSPSVVRARTCTARVVLSHLVLMRGSFRSGCILILGF